MTAAMKLLAVLVHRGLVRESDARAAMQSGDPVGWLVAKGVCTRAQWDAWSRSEGGIRPDLTRYELGDELGEGGTARVFAAVDRVNKERVALKVLRPELATDPQQVEAFVREARLLLDLEHPHVVRGLRVAKEKDVYFFAMEPLPGQCLQDLLAEQGRIDEGMALRIVAEVADALGALHDRGLVHRDVKPGNVMWSEDRGAVLIDLGFAVEGRSRANDSDKTAGTVHYIAPEQARGSGELDVRADIYALGATLFHLVTGSLPFQGSSQEVLAKQVLESLSGDRIRSLGLSPHVHYFIEKMMQKDREIRFQDPRQLQQEVQAWLGADRARRELEVQAEKRRPRLAGRASMFDRNRRRRPGR
jgi:serine/threonine protein kinase